MGMSRVVVSSLFIFVMSITCAHAEENRYCAAENWDGPPPTTRIVNWRAGMVTTGKPSPLRVAFDSLDPSCRGMPCLARGGVTGVELRQAGSSVCVGLPGKGKLATMFGWIPASRWRATDSSPQPVVRWVGVWQNQTAKIIVQSRGDGQLDIRGHAVRTLDANGSHDIYGDFAITGKPESGVVTGKDDDSSCEVSARLVGDYLVVTDDDACGGMGVSFAGMYRVRHH